MTTDLKMGIMEWLLLLLLSVLWGGSFFFAKIALADIPPMTLVFLRVGVAALALAVIMKGTGRSIPKDKKLWATFGIMGLLNNLIPFCLFFWGQTHIGAGLASIFNAMAPVFTVLIAHVFLSDEKLTFGKINGVLCGLAGVAFMIGIDMNNGMGMWTILAMFGCVIAALSYGFAGVYGRRFSANGVDPLTVAFGQISASTVMMFPVMMLVDQPWTIDTPSVGSLLAVAMLALVCTAFGYVLFFRILARGGATNISLVAFLIPVSAILLSTVFLGEKLGPNHLVGVALIFLGLTALDGRLWQAIARRFRTRNGRPISPGI